MPSRLPAIFTVLVSLALIPSEPPAAAQGLTKEQGDEIIRELGNIRLLLQQMERKLSQPVARQAPAVPTRVSVATKGFPSLGRADAPVTLVEFTDYQCPFCKKFFESTLPALKKTYVETGKLRIVVRDLPLPFHKDARKAAQATHCAGEHGKYWAMHDILFENQKRLSVQNLSGYAARLGLDRKTFDACLSSNRHLAAIDSDVKAAAAARITGTPSFVIGKTEPDVIDGVRVVGAQPFAAFDRQIRELLASVKSGG